MDDESKFWFIIGLFLTAVGLIGLRFCLELYLAIGYSTNMLLLMTLIMLFIFLGGILTSIFELSLEFLEWLDKRMEG